MLQNFFTSTITIHTWVYVLTIVALAGGLIVDILFVPRQRNRNKGDKRSD